MPGKIDPGIAKLVGPYLDVSCFNSEADKDDRRDDTGRTLDLELREKETILEFFSHMQEQNPGFFYAIHFNDQHKLKNLFWVDAKGIEDYNYFHDVVCFDIKCVTDGYRVPLVLFIGVNHHIQHILLGCGLIAEGITSSFKWVLNTWLTAMGDQPPGIFLTDHENRAVREAVAETAPQSAHFFCPWRVLERVHNQLRYLGSWRDAFAVKFEKCVFNSLNKEQFAKRWQRVADRFQLREAEWFHSLYEDRHRWVPCFMRGFSFSGLCAKSLNAKLDKLVLKETSLLEFLQQYQLFLEGSREEEAKAEFDAWHETPALRSPSPFEKQMTNVYTREIFSKFQGEVLGAAACHLSKEFESEDTTLFSIKDFVDNKNHMVELVSVPKTEISCSCRSFEYRGYLCRHAIVVLQMSGIFSVPHRYILQRWTNVAKSRLSLSESSDTVKMMVTRYNDLCRRVVVMSEEGSLSYGSYNIASRAMREALNRCSAINSLSEDGVHARAAGSNG